jgi:hypothetical protein
MLEMIAANLTGKAVAVAGGGVAVVVSTWVLKKIPNATIKAKVGMWMYGLGVGVTLGMAKWKFTKPIWNKVVEPYFIDLIDNVLVTGLSKFVEGMRSDNV